MRSKKLFLFKYEKSETQKVCEYTHRIHFGQGQRIFFKVSRSFYCKHLTDLDHSEFCFLVSGERKVANSGNILRGLAKLIIPMAYHQ
jgi:hypothetical protein